LEIAPDKAPVLRGFENSLYPSVWTGSAAQTLAPRQAVLETLLAHPDSVVAAWAREALKAMQQRIEHDGSRDAIREQAFE
jgi:hypothetical protein